MSVVPNNELNSADSLELITFPITDQVPAGGSYSRDFYTRYKSFWKQVIIRNFNIADNVLYRTQPNEVQKTLPPLSERTVKGWGSFFEATTAAAVPDVELHYEGVTRENALRK